MLYQLSYSRNYWFRIFILNAFDAIFNISRNLVEIAVFSGLNVLFSAFENSDANIYVFFLSPNALKKLYPIFAPLFFERPVQSGNLLNIVQFV